MKKKILSSAILAGFVLFAASGFAGTGSLKVSKQATLDVPPSMAWALIGDFNGLNRWHPAVTASEMSGSPQKAGAKRILTLPDGAQIKEELLDFNDSAMSYTYKITDSPLPVSDYTSTIKIEANAQGTSTITWSSDFNAKDAPDDKAVDVITGVYAAGLQALENLY